MSELTHRERNRLIFEGKHPGGVFFQPRLEPWFDWNRRGNRIPALQQWETVVDFLDHLGVSMRYFDYFTGHPNPVRVVFDASVRIEIRDTEKGLVREYATPHGTLRSVEKGVAEGGCRTVEYPIKGPDDFRKAEWLFERMRFVFDEQVFESGDRLIGDRGLPQFCLMKSPFQRLAHEWMEYEELIYAVADDPGSVLALCEVFDTAHEQLVGQVGASQRIELVNFGENIHAGLLTQEMLDRFIMPFYEHRCGQLRDMGIWTTVHADGDLKGLLSRLGELPFDGIEAPTPQPQGDVTIEELSEALPGKIVLDGIPAILFLPGFSIAQLQDCTRRLVDAFGSRLVLGISDELPMGAGAEVFEKLEWITDFCAQSR